MKIVRRRLTSWCSKREIISHIFLPDRDKKYNWELWCPTKCTAFASHDLAKEL